MKRTVWALAAVVFALLWCAAAPAADDTQEHPSCLRCGMDRARFGQSRLLIEYADAPSAGLCSIHCAAVQLAMDLDRDVKSVLVGDYGTKRLIEAEKAFWVIGGKVPGVMTRTAKWAFAAQADAEAFIREQGGATATFESAMEAAYRDMYEDTKAIRERRRQRMKERTQRSAP